MRQKLWVCFLSSVRREVVINYVISNNVFMRMEVGANVILMVTDRDKS